MLKVQGLSSEQAKGVNSKMAQPVHLQSTLTEAQSTLTMAKRATSVKPPSDDLSVTTDRIAELVKAGWISKEESDLLDDLIADYVAAQQDSRSPAAAKSMAPARTIMDLSKAFKDDERFVRQVQRSLANLPV